MTLYDDNNRRLQRTLALATAVAVIARVPSTTSGVFDFGGFVEPVGSEPADTKPALVPYGPDVPRAAAQWKRERRGRR
jgi:hypothetical protein